MKSVRVLTIVGARPQFIKAAAVSRAVERFNAGSNGVKIDESIVHTGQHYDENMSKVFFDELEIPRPKVNLEVGSGGHGAQTGAMLEKIEQVLLEGEFDWVLIYGDTNSTLAGALAAAKLHVPIAHIEAGLRSFNRRMPEEVNRVLADTISTLLFCPSEVAANNLANEGVTEGVHVVGDVMYDSVLFNVALAEERSDVIGRLGLDAGDFYLATVHRAENTDDAWRLGEILEAFSKVDRDIVLPLHPRTRHTLGEGVEKIGGRVRVIDPVSYLDILVLDKHARMVLTDSGGVQKEAYWLDTPCVTLRDETEWVELVDAGVNKVVGANSDAILSAVAAFERGGDSAGDSVERNIYGDGHSADRIVKILADSYV